MRDDVDFAHPHEAILADFVFAVANPVLTEPITPEAIRAWRTGLDAAGPPVRP